MKNRNLITILLGLFYSASLLAEPESPPQEPLPWYQLELIVFEPVDPVQTNEKWPVVIEEPAPLDIIELSAPVQPVAKQSGELLEPAAFQLLNPEELELKAVADSLQKNDNHKIMLHIAWRQPLVENAGSTQVHIHSGLNEHFLAENKAQVATPQNEPVLLNNLPDPEADSTREESIQATPVENFVDGTIALSLTRFLHLRAHMVYFNPEIDLARQIVEQQTDKPVIERFLLKESRRVKRKELHYLDHPYFGIIARVTRYETEAEKQTKSR